MLALKRMFDVVHAMELNLEKPPSKEHAAVINSKLLGGGRVEWTMLMRVKAGRKQIEDLMEEAASAFENSGKIEEGGVLKTTYVTKSGRKNLGATQIMQLVEHERGIYSISLHYTGPEAHSAQAEIALRLIRAREHVIGVN